MKRFRLLLIISWIFLGSNLFSQKNSFELGFSIMPLISDNLLTHGDDVDPSIASNYRNREVSRFGGSVNLIIRESITSKFSLQSGLGFTLNGYNYRKTATSWGAPDPTLPIAIKSQYIYQNINIPLLMSYNFKMFRKNCYIQSGLVGVFAIKKSIFFTRYFLSNKEISTSSNDDSVRNNNLNASIGIGMDIIKRENYNLFIQPNFDINLFNIGKKTTPIQRRIYSLGLSLGMMFR